MHSAMTRGRLMGAALDIAAAAAEHRPAGRNGCTSGRSRPQRESSSRGSARTPRSGHRSSGRLARVFVFSIILAFDVLAAFSHALEIAGELALPRTFPLRALRAAEIRRSFEASTACCPTCSRLLLARTMTIGADAGPRHCQDEGRGQEPRWRQEAKRAA
jgi:hypothetical protein